jgi:hypothetical protein
MRWGRTNIWEGEQWIVAQRKGGSEEDKNRNKKIVMINLVNQNKTKNPHLLQQQ